MQVISKTGFVADAWADETAMVTLDVAEDVSDLVDQFDQLKLIVIPFASSADGRGFTHAARLRELGFTGHIRAQGHILVDQFRAALRCGFDDIQISDAQAQRNPEPQWLAVPLGAGYQSRLFAA